MVMDEDKFNKLFTNSIPTVHTVPGMENYLTMSRELLEDYKRQARAEERESIIKFLELLALDPSGINLQGAIAQLQKNKEMK
jgi:hypothetical protein